MAEAVARGVPLLVFAVTAAAYAAIIVVVSVFGGAYELSQPPVAQIIAAQMALFAAAAVALFLHLAGIRIPKRAMDLLLAACALLSFLVLLAAVWVAVSAALA